MAVADSPRARLAQSAARRVRSPAKVRRLSDRYFKRYGQRPPGGLPKPFRTRSY